MALESSHAMDIAQNHGLPYLNRWQQAVTPRSDDFLRPSLGLRTPVFVMEMLMLTLSNKVRLRGCSCKESLNQHSVEGMVSTLKHFHAASVAGVVV